MRRATWQRHLADSPRGAFFVPGRLTLDGMKTICYNKKRTGARSGPAAFETSFPAVFVRARKRCSFHYGTGFRHLSSQRQASSEWKLNGYREVSPFLRRGSIPFNARRHRRVFMGAVAFGYRSLFRLHGGGSVVSSSAERSLRKTSRAHMPLKPQRVQFLSGAMFSFVNFCRK